MKKQLLFLLMLVGFGFQAKSQVCTIDTVTDPGIYPDTLVNLPKGYINTPYGTVIQIRVFTDTLTSSGNVHVTDIQINSVTGLPAGFTYSCNPANCTFPGGGNGCIYLSGNPTAAQAGVYPIIVNVTLHGKLLNIIPVSQASQTLGYKIVILGAPVANFSGSQTTVCKGETVSFTDLSTNLPTSWAWSFPGGTPSSSTLQNPTITYSTSGTYNATLTATSPAGNNSQTKNSYITVNSAPAASITVTGSLAICQGSSVLLTANSGAGYSYQWMKNGIDIANATSVSYQATTAGTYKVRVTKSNGCYKISTTKSVSIISVAAVASAGGPTTFCSGGSVLLSANTGTGLTWKWRKNGVDIVGATASTYTANATGTYKVIVTNANGCTAASNSISVTSNALPTATITANGPLTFCAGGSVIFTASSGVNYGYVWKKNGIAISGATAINYTATKAGTYKVLITNSNTGCSKTSSTKTVVVNCKDGISVETESDFSEVLLYPNPANETVNLDFTMNETEKAEVEIYSLQGQLVSKLPEKIYETGRQTLQISTSHIASGMYMIRMKTRTSSKILKMTIARD